VPEHVWPSTLHVAALPFPSSQGTQAALLSIVRAAAGDAARRGERVAVLTYEGGDGRTVLPTNVVHRRTRAPVRNASLRSGPSIAKLAEDVALVEALRHAPEAHVVAHHVEAGLACVLAGRAFTWIAHTALGPELPLYAPSWAALAPLLRDAGEALDRLVASRAERVLAVSPLLARRCRERLGVEADVIPIPWSAAPPIHEDDKRAARAALGLEDAHEVVLYAGNLDHYQGLDTACAALGQLAHRRGALRWLVATESDPRPLLEAARRSGLAPRIVHAPLARDVDRRSAHAAADLVIVPRRLEAGVSVKILEALAHALPTLAVRAATGGFPFEQACVVVEDDPIAMARGIDEILASPFRRMALAAAGPGYLAAHHTDDACVTALRRSRTG
jgi:glycosyltransferase involved in cell wall biosynthesis